MSPNLGTKSCFQSTLSRISLLAVVGLGVASCTAAAQSLQVTYGTKGVSTLGFQGVELVNTTVNPGDLFHIWHMKATDLNGTTLTTGQTGWGESNDGESWDASSKTETYRFDWGSIAVQFVQNGNNLDMVVTETNNPGSGLIFQGAEIYPFALHFPNDPVGFSGYSQFAITTLGPGVSAADFGSGVVTSVIPDETQPLYGGWKNLGTNTYNPLMTSTAPDGLPTFLPHQDRAVVPGASWSYTVSLRFTPEGTAAQASDAYNSFAQTYPSQMTWSDRRIVGTAYLASSPDGSAGVNQPGGFPTNPRRYFNDSSVDITTPTGLQAFQKRMLAQASSNVVNAVAMNSQGVITWDIEGEQFPQNTSYVCSPDQIAVVAPEMESIILDPASAYFGQRLDDAYFKTMSSAGLRTGVCLRPQSFTLLPNGTASQVVLSTNAAIIANLENKARFANARWGTSLFYVDSTVDSNGGTLDPAIFQQLITDLPSFLFIPEESTPRYYAYTAPFYSFIFHTDLGTPASIYKVYPTAFGANLVNDVSASTLANYLPQLTQSVRNGDILMGHADYWQANDPTLVSIYEAAGVGAAPVQATPVISWPVPAAIPYGTPLSGTQLSASANTSGTFTYTPAAGTLLPAGTNSLMTTFTPADAKDYTSATATVALSVLKAAPVLSWSSPAPITTAVALGGAQLDAVADQPGTFTYTPAAGVTLPVGTTTLQVLFQPTDSANYQPVTAQTTVNVTAAQPVAPALTWGTPAAIAYGTQLGAAQLNASASTPGTFTYLPAAGTVLHAGTQVLEVTFVPADLTQYTTVHGSVTLVVSQATPALSWPTPHAIVASQRLNAAVLDPASNVTGYFTFDPPAGSFLAAGTHTLTASFHPRDAKDYASAQIQVTLLVNPTPKAVR